MLHSLQQLFHYMGDRLDQLLAPQYRESHYISIRDTTMKDLILSGPNHSFDKCAAVMSEFLGNENDIEVTLEDDKDILLSGMKKFDSCIFGTGFYKRIRDDDGNAHWVPELTSAQEEGIYNYVAAGGGLIGVHGTCWRIGERPVALIGGHANWHPPVSTFTVNIAENDHPITEGVSDFEVDDEIYMTAWFPEVEIHATAQYANWSHPMAWSKSYGEGRVFYTTLGHGPDTFTRPSMQQLITQGVRWTSQQYA